MKKVLIISYLFPPLHCGVGRQVKIAKYLPQYGWQPLVLTVQGSRLRPIYDHTLVREIQQKAKIYRITYPEIKILARCFCKLTGARDPSLPWVPFAILEGIRIIIKEKPDAIFSTFQYSSNHVVALLLKKIFKLPWVADFRDPWTQNPFDPYPENIFNIDQRLEAAVIKNADAVTGITDSLVRDLSQKYPKEPKGKFLTVHHGFDPEDFEVLKKEPVHKFTITYAGSLFRGRRDPELFLGVIKEMIGQKEIARDTVQVQFMGAVDLAKDIVRRLNIQDIVKICGYVPHREVFQRLTNSDVLLLMIELKGGICTTGKLFEYVASGTPIIALIPPDGEAAKLINETNSGFTIHPEDKERIRSVLSLLYKERRQRLQPKTEIIRQYDVKLKVKKFAEVFDELCVT